MTRPFAGRYALRSQPSQRGWYLSSSSLDPSARPPELLGILCAGQSNDVGTQGPTAVIDPVLDAGDPRILQWSFDGQGTPANANKLIAAIDPLLHPGAPAATRGIGPAMPFARALLPTLLAYQKIVLIPVAVGGTGLIADVWASPAGARYVDAKAALTNFLTSNPGAICGFIHWWQGENDMFYNRPGASYKPAVDAVFAGFRSVSGAENAMIIIGQPVQEYWAGTPVMHEIWKALADTPLRISNAYFIPTPAGSNNPADTWHVTAAAQRVIGANWAAAAIAGSAQAYTRSRPPTPVGFTLHGEVAEWTESGAPAVVLQSRAAGSGGAWTETVVYPLKYQPGGKRRMVIPGSGSREVQLVARARGGDSDPTPIQTYTIPAGNAPTALWDLDFHGSPVDGSNIFTAMNSVGSDVVPWTPYGSPVRALVNGRGAFNQTARAQDFFRALRVPAGSYSFVCAFYDPAIQNSGVLLGVGALTANIDITVKLNASNQGQTIQAWHNNDSAIAITASYDSVGPGYICIGVVYDSTKGTNNLTIYVNGCPVAVGTVNARSKVAPSTKAFDNLADGRGDGTTGLKLAWKVYGAALTEADMVQIAHDVKTAYGINWYAA